MVKDGYRNSVVCVLATEPLLSLVACRLDHNGHVIVHESNSDDGIQSRISIQIITNVSR